MRSKIDSVAVVGMGALGLLFGGHLTTALGPEKVQFLVNDKRRARYEREGVRINGRAVDLGLIDEAKASPVDLVLFAVKGTALDSALYSARNLVGHGTILLSVMNGITSEERIGRHFGEEHVLTCVAQGMDAVKIHNALTYTKFGEIVLGYEQQEVWKKGDLHRVCDLFDRTELPYHVDLDIRHRLWSKWMLNVGVNQVVMAEEGNYGTIQRAGRERDRMIRAMREAMHVARLEGISLTEHDLETYVALVDTLSAEGMPSMRQDALENRPTEVDLFASTVIALGEKHGLACPENATLYDQIKAKEREYRSVD